MEELLSRAQKLNEELKSATEKLHIAGLSSQLESFDKRMKDPAFWNNPIEAQTISKQFADLSRRLKPWQEIGSGVSDIIELAKLNDPEINQDLEKQLVELESKFDVLKSDLKFSGPYDDRGAILSIRAGAGGTDAQDWAQMLLRMYVRWAESKNFKVKVVDESAGEEAGIKSVTVEIEGDYTYGKLKSENGVHRLVRLSPFNADNLRQTSFAKVDVMPIIDQPDDLQIDDKDIRVDVYRSSGHGGQSVNTTDSAVRLTHIPTGIVVAIQNERSQLQNRDMAMTILRSKLIQLQLEQHQEKIDELKGPNQSAEWGNQIRSYVLHPYKQVKDLRSKFETSDVDSVLNGGIDNFINAYLNYSMGVTE